MSTDKPRSTVATRMSGIREDWLAKAREEILEPDLRHRRSASSSLGLPGRTATCFPTCWPTPAAATTSTARSSSSAGLLPRRRSGGAAHARRDRVRQRRRRDAAPAARYGPTRAAPGIVGIADLTLGDARRGGAGGPHAPRRRPRFRGIRHAAAWDDKTPRGPQQPHQPAAAPAIATTRFREGFAALAPLGPQLRRLALSPPAPRADRAGARLPGARRSCSTTSAVRSGSAAYAGQARRDLRRLDARHRGAGQLPERAT